MYNVENGAYMELQPVNQQLSGTTTDRNFRCNSFALMGKSISANKSKSETHTNLYLNCKEEKTKKWTNVSECRSDQHQKSSTAAVSYSQVLVILVRQDESLFTQPRFLSQMSTEVFVLSFFFFFFRFTLHCHENFVHMTEICPQWNWFSRIYCNINFSGSCCRNFFKENFINMQRIFWSALTKGAFALPRVFV